jgi:Type IIA topoisomerase (DNA gyrase/topo II, topoisomerase IV), A subunit
MRYVLTDIHGNAGGSIQTGEYAGQMVSEDPPAAPRYLEVRATEVAEKLYMDEVVRGLGDWRPNYDGTSSELVRYVPKLPALLLTGAQGIASGYACHYVPYNLRDVVAATKAWIKRKDISDKSLLAKFSHPPELPQGGRVVKDDGLANALREGKGSITVLGEWETQDDMRWGKRSTRPALVITRLANGSSEKFLEKVRALAEEDKLPGLLDAADHLAARG